MKAIGVNRFGGPEVLEVVELPEPQPGPGEVRIRVHAVAVNPTDLMARSGGYGKRLDGQKPPYIPGMDSAGVIDALGPAADGRLALGERVIAVTAPASPHKGSYAQQIIVPAASAVRAPKGVDFPAASTLLMNALTVRLGLDAIGLKPGQTLAVTGSAGAVGGYAIQLAKADGLRVLADVSESPADRTLLTELGADVLVPRGPGFTERVRKLEPNGVPGLFDGALLNGEAAPAIADGGGLVTVRGWNEPVERGIRVLPVMVANGLKDTAKLERLRDQVESGALTLRVAKVLPASQAAEAHRLLAAGGVRGRIVLDFNAL
ncbi:MAG: NADP-dependent oxidoreductase [Deltaproteobacteria bacterium]|nr:NADP-dependent oxidoreductase [Deltaproteobacteria bacterium]